MRKTITDKLPRFFLCLLMDFGLIYTLLGVLAPDVSPTPAFLLGALLCAVMEGISLTRRSALAGSAALFLFFLIWLTGGSGAVLMADLFRAFALMISGVSGAMSLMAREASLLVAGFLSVLCFFSTRKGVGSPGAILLTGGTLMILWLADLPELTIRLIPSGISAMTLLLMDRHPEISLRRVLPASAALLILAWLLTPQRGVVIPELKEMADSFRQSVIDRLFFTEPRDVFSLAAEGYYPQGASQLGGPAAPTNHPVMQVSTPKLTYLRGVLMNEYDGRSWRNTLGGRRFLWDASGMAAQRAMLFNQNLPSASLSSSLTASAQVSVRMLGDGASTLFVPGRLRELRTGGELVPYFTNSAEVFVTRNLRDGDTWTVSAPLISAGDAGLETLVEGAGGQDDLQWESILETYTALPSHLEEPVWQLAADVTQGLNTSYAKAFALQNYLRRNYRYTLDAAYQPAQLDFVTNFLFNTREGYCTYFASAMTVLCRMAGLPARYVEGYLAEPNDQGEAVVTGMNGHAWTEVYFRGFGWVTFDPTPSQGRGENGAGGDMSTDPRQEKEPSVSPTPTPEPEAGTVPPSDLSIKGETPTPELPSAEGDPVRNGEEEPVLSWWLLLILLILLCLAAGALRVWHTDPSHRERKLTSEQERFDLWLRDLLLELSVIGCVRRPGETLMSFTRRLDGEGKVPVALGQVGECASLLHYGRVQPMETDTALARDAALALRKQLPRGKRLRCVWGRCCQKTCQKEKIKL